MTPLKIKADIIWAATNQDDMQHLMGAVPTGYGKSLPLVVALQESLSCCPLVSHLPTNVKSRGREICLPNWNKYDGNEVVSAN